MPSSANRILPHPFLAAAALACLAVAPPLRAQVSLSSAVDLAVSNSPRVHMAQADVSKARAALSQAHDAYLPSVYGVMDLGYSYGAPIGEPTLFSFSAHSLVFNYSQHDYIRSAVSGLAAANFSLDQVREEVAEDAAVTYLQLDFARQRRAALAQQLGYADRLTAIVQDRLDAGQDTQLSLLQSRRTAAQIRLQMLQLDDDLAGYRTHLLLLDGLPDGPLATEPNSVPALPALPPPPLGIDTVALYADPPPAPASAPGDTPAVAAAFANAQAKQQQAFGDSRYMYRPQIGFFAQYSRFSTFNNYQIYYPAFANNTLNAIAIGINITVPFYDRNRLDQARVSEADAQHARQEAVYARQQMFDGRVRLQHASAELAAQSDLATLDQQIAQQQLEAVLIELQAGTGNPAGPQLTPRDEQNARIQERQHFLEFLDAQSRLHETRIHLLRLTGGLDAWLKSAAALPTP